MDAYVVFEINEGWMLEMEKKKILRSVLELICSFSASNTLDR